jgi:hypothetical protein
MLISLPQDKANHACYGGLIFLLALCLLRRPDAAYAAVVAIACGKETADWLSNRRAIKAGMQPDHGVELLDIVATCAGGAVPLVAKLI